MWELDYKKSWVLKNWCFLTVVLESPLDSKEIQPFHPKGNQSWIFTGRTDAKAETLVLWPADVKIWLIWKDCDAGKDWRREEKGATEDEMVGWHHQLNGHKFEKALGVGDGQGSLVHCSPWGHKESDMTEQLNWTELDMNKLGSLLLRKTESILYMKIIHIIIFYLCLSVKLLQSCLTLCDPMGSSPPGFSVHEILQARTLELPYALPADLPNPMTEYSILMSPILADGFFTTSAMTLVPLTIPWSFVSTFRAFLQITNENYSTSFGNGADILLF